MNAQKLKINKEKINIFEIGAGDAFCSKTLNYWGNNKYDITLFEPNPILYKSLLKKVKDINNIKLYNIAIFNEEKIGELVCAGVLSYIRDIPSPINTIYLNKLNEILSEFTIPVNFMKFDSFDKGDIDYLILGMEGSEFTVFENLISRPHIISLHNYFANDYKYTFPYFDYIKNWCVKNNYYIIFGIPDILLVNKKSIENETLVLN
jgi:FkbM family methyltransferase